MTALRLRAVSIDSLSTSKTCMTRTPGRVARGAVAQLEQAGDVLGDQHLGAAGDDVLELALQDGLAALGLLVEVHPGAAAAHRRLLERDDLEAGHLGEQAGAPPSGRARRWAASRARRWRPASAAVPGWRAARRRRAARWPAGCAEPRAARRRRAGSRRRGWCRTTCSAPCMRPRRRPGRRPSARGERRRWPPPCPSWPRDRRATWRAARCTPAWGPPPRSRWRAARAWSPRWPAARPGSGSSTPGTRPGRAPARWRRAARGCAGTPSCAAAGRRAP